MVCPPLGGAVCRGHGQLSLKPLFLLQALQKWQLDFGVSFYLLGPEFAPTTACMHLFLVPYGFFIFCCSWRGVSRCKHCSTVAKGPNPQPVPWPHSLPQDLNLSLVWWVPSSKVFASSLDTLSLNPGGGSCSFCFRFLCSFVSSLSPFS